MARSAYDSKISSLARILLGGFFIFSAYSNIANFGDIIGSTHVPVAPILVILGILLKFSLGTMLIVRYHTRYAAFVLSLYLVTASIIFYGPHLWNDNNFLELIFFRNIAILGGLLFIYSHSRGYKQWQGSDLK